MTAKGKIARDQDFFDREEDRKHLWHALLEGNHILLCAPRRIGKSSLMAKMVQELNDPEPPSLLMAEKVIDVESCSTISGFLSELDDAFPQSWILMGLSRIQKLFPSKLNVSVQYGSISGQFEVEREHGNSVQNWLIKAKALQRRLSPLPLLICLDEFPVFLERVLHANAQVGAQFLSWLRSWRQSQTKCRFIFAGSVGIQSLLVRFEQTTQFNDCQLYRLGPFSKSAALKMLEELSQREGNLQPAAHVLETLCERSGWLSPYFLTILFLEAQKVAQERTLETQPDTELLEPEDIEIACKRFSSDVSVFRHWYARLAQDFAQKTNELMLVKAILRHIALAKNGLTRKQLANRLAKAAKDQDDFNDHLQQMLLYLNEHGYITAEEPFQFLSFLLRDYWRKNHAAQ